MFSLVILLHCHSDNHDILKLGFSGCFLQRVLFIFISLEKYLASVIINRLNGLALPFLLLTLNVYLYFRNHFAKVKLRALSSEEIEAIRQKKTSLVASRLRFIPKTHGLRPIVKVTSVVEAQALSKESREKKVCILFIVL